MITSKSGYASGIWGKIKRMRKRTRCTHYVRKRMPHKRMCFNMEEIERESRKT